MPQFRITKVLVANRGEIAVRIIRAAHDSGLEAVAVYADSDADALFVRLADEAFALRGRSPAETYLDVDKLLDVAARAGADAVHPGYGFLAENAGFARAVQDAGLVWVGPPPAAIEALGDKVRARHIAEKVGAPMAPGTPGPVADVEEALAFVDAAGLPVAIKAAHGGGGRGLKVARTREEVAERFASATREAVAAFGRGECFVERFLDRPRHVETQCLADAHGTVVVVSTRDCSLQRRHQKVVEEAPAPFLTPEQHDTLVTASKAILREAGYVGAGTCEFLIDADGTVAFLEVNTRLQVEHPVSEEVTGIDLVREQFRIAAGGRISPTDPQVRGHSIEFRINAEDAGRRFLPGPGTITVWEPPSGPGVRVDEGYRAGMTIPGEFDSLIAKLVVTGADRAEALARARRALAEFRVEGLATTLPFHRAVVADPAFVAADGDFAVHTGWIEDGFAGVVAPHPQDVTPPDETPEPEVVVVEVNGRRMEVRLPAGLRTTAAPPPGRPSTSGPAALHPTPPVTAPLTVPMHCRIISIAAGEGTEVAAGDPVVVVEAMKMEQTITSPRAGIITGLTVQPGQTIPAGTTICAVQAPGVS